MPLAFNRLLGSQLLWLIGGRLSLLLFSLLSTGLMTRDLGPHGFGDFRTAVGFLGLVVLLADLGLASISSVKSLHPTPTRIESWAIQLPCG